MEDEFVRHYEDVSGIEAKARGNLFTVLGYSFLLGRLPRNPTSQTFPINSPQ